MNDYQLTHDEIKKEIRKYPICLLANDLIVPMNVGNLFRMADALGVEKLYLCGKTPIPPNKKINRSARSTVKFVEHEYRENALELIQDLKEQGYKIISLEITKKSTDIRHFQIAPTDKICLLIGTENYGIGQELLDMSEAAIHIPMHGYNSSMNVAMAASIAVYELTRQLDKD